MGVPLFSLSPFYLVYVIEYGSQSCDIPMIAARISYGAAYICPIQGSDKRYILPVFTLQLLIIIVFRWLISTKIKNKILKFESWLIDLLPVIFSVLLIFFHRHGFLLNIDWLEYSTVPVYNLEYNKIYQILKSRN